MIKVDELDSSLRQFFELLKSYIKKKKSSETSCTFTAREIRREFKLSKTQLSRFLCELVQLEYIQIVAGSANRGYQYQISYWDDYVKFRERIKANLLEQIEALK